MIADPSSLRATRIFVDPAAEDEVERAYAECLAENVRIVTGDVIAIVGTVLALLCALLLIVQRDWSERPAMALLVSSVVAAYGAILAHSAADRRDAHLTTLRTKRPYIVSAEAERALRRILEVRVELRADKASAVTVENLANQAWRLIRALDTATPTWRFEDPDLTRLLVAEKARRGEHAALIALAEQADALTRPPEEDLEPGGPSEVNFEETEAAAETDPEIDGEIAALLEERESVPGSIPGAGERPSRIFGTPV